MKKTASVYIACIILTGLGVLASGLAHWQSESLLRLLLYTLLNDVGVLSFPAFGIDAVVASGNSSHRTVRGGSSMLLACQTETEAHSDPLQRRKHIRRHLLLLSGLPSEVAAIAGAGHASSDRRVRVDLFPAEYRFGGGWG